MRYLERLSVPSLPVASLALAAHIDRFNSFTMRSMKLSLLTSLYIAARTLSRLRPPPPPPPPRRAALSPSSSSAPASLSPVSPSLARVRAPRARARARAVAPRAACRNRAARREALSVWSRPCLHRRPRRRTPPRCPSAAAPAPVPAQAQSSLSPSPMLASIASVDMPVWARVRAERASDLIEQRAHLVALLLLIEPDAVHLRGSCGTGGTEARARTRTRPMRSS